MVMREGAGLPGAWTQATKAKHYDTPGSQGISHSVLKGLNGG